MLRNLKVDPNRLLFGSGFGFVIACFSIVTVLNLLTFELGPSRVLANLIEANGLVGALLSFIVFDSWGSVVGLLGVIALFAPILIGSDAHAKLWRSYYFVLASLGLSVLACAAWDILIKNPDGSIAYGASAIAIVALSVIFSEACFFSLRFLRNRTRMHGGVALFFVYLTLIVTTLWFVLLIQPIFMPSPGFNWQVHGLGFTLGAFSTIIFEYLLSTKHNESREEEFLVPKCNQKRKLSRLDLDR